MYAIPVIAFILLFGRVRIIVEALLCFPAFIFFTPTYLSILPIYALARINDISWGTKGLDAAAGKNVSHLQESWRQIRLIYVFKFLFWNIFFGIIFVSMGSTISTRFFITFVIMILLGSTLAIKAFIGVGYLIYFRFRKNIP